MAASLQQKLIETLDRLEQMSIDELLERRYARLMDYGRFSD
jgi:acetyl-CoA carboxylase carboxyl transferase subunit alpha